jgi:hypothetical protein
MSARRLRRCEAGGGGRGCGWLSAMGTADPQGGNSTKAEGRRVQSRQHTGVAAGAGSQAAGSQGERCMGPIPLSVNAGCREGTTGASVAEDWGCLLGEVLGGRREGFEVSLTCLSCMRGPQGSVRLLGWKGPRVLAAPSSLRRHSCTTGWAGRQGQGVRWAACRQQQQCKAAASAVAGSPPAPGHACSCQWPTADLRGLSRTPCAHAHQPPA